MQESPVKLNSTKDAELIKTTPLSDSTMVLPPLVIAGFVGFQIFGCSLEVQAIKNRSKVDQNIFLIVVLGARVNYYG